MTHTDWICEELSKIETKIKKNEDEDQIVKAINFINKRVFPVIWGYQEYPPEFRTAKQNQSIYRIKALLNYQIRDVLKKHVEFPPNCELGEFYIRDVNF